MDRDKTIEKGAIGVFDSGYGGLTVLKSIVHLMPEYDYIYLGDNARAPYGDLDFQTIYEYTREGVAHLFAQGCPLVILACNTASAKSLRTIQQVDLAHSEDPTRRVLGIILPTVEHLPKTTHTGHVGLVATSATVSSDSYKLELDKVAPDVILTQQTAPLWAFLVESGELENNPGVRFFVDREVQALLAQDPEIDTIQLACTHYPMLLPRIQEAVPHGIQVVEQGDLVANSLKDYLYRHPEMERRLSKGEGVEFQTTEKRERFKRMSQRFLSDHFDIAKVTQVALQPFEKR